jgi:hypothetical protein
MSIPLPPLPLGEIITRDWWNEPTRRFTADQLRARDKEIVRCVLHAAFAAGWREAAEWAKRDDLLADMDSRLYHKAMSKLEFHHE